MGKKTVGLIVIVLMAILSLSLYYSMMESPSFNVGDVKTLEVYSEGPVNLPDIIEDVETASYYEGYDNDTLNWMKSLGDKAVFSGNGTFVIMGFDDAGRIPSVYATDVIITEEFECRVLETHSLGDVDYPKKVFYVNDVKYLGEKIVDIPGGGA